MPYRLLLKILGPLVILAAAGLWVHHYGATQYKAGEAATVAAYKAAQEAATARHNQTLAKVEAQHEIALQDLQSRLDAAIAHPVVRRVQIPASACTSPQASDAGVPEEHPADGLLTVDDPDYGRLRSWLLAYAAATPASGSRSDAPVSDSGSR